MLSDPIHIVKSIRIAQEQVRLIAEIAQLCDLVIFIQQPDDRYVRASRLDNLKIAGNRPEAVVSDEHTIIGEWQQEVLS